MEISRTINLSLPKGNPGLIMAVLKDMWEKNGPTHMYTWYWWEDPFNLNKESEYARIELKTNGKAVFSRGSYYNKDHDWSKYVAVADNKRFIYGKDAVPNEVYDDDTAMEKSKLNYSNAVLLGETEWRFVSWNGSQPIYHMFPMTLTPHHLESIIDYAKRGVRVSLEGTTIKGTLSWQYGAVYCATRAGGYNRSVMDSLQYIKRLRNTCKPYLTLWTKE